MPRVIPEYKAQARSRILTAASEEFRKNGFARTSLEDIARRVGVSRAAVYLYFSSKLDLLKAIQARDRTRVEQRLARIAESADPVETFASLMDEFAVDPSASQNHLEMFARAREDAEVRQVLQLERSFDAKAIRGILARLRARGISQGVSDPEAAVLLVRSALVDAVIAYGLGGDHRVVRRELVRALRGVIGTRPSSDRRRRGSGR